MLVRQACQYTAGGSDRHRRIAAEASQIETRKTAVECKSRKRVAMSEGNVKVKEYRRGRELKKKKQEREVGPAILQSVRSDLQAYWILDKHESLLHRGITP